MKVYHHPDVDPGTAPKIVRKNGKFFIDHRLNTAERMRGSTSHYAISLATVVEAWNAQLTRDFPGVLQFATHEAKALEGYPVKPQAAPMRWRASWARDNGAGGSSPYETKDKARARANKWIAEGAAGSSVFLASEDGKQVIPLSPRPQVHDEARPEVHYGRPKTEAEHEAGTYRGQMSAMEKQIRETAYSLFVEPALAALPAGTLTDAERSLLYRELVGKERGLLDMKAIADRIGKATPWGAPDFGELFANKAFKPVTEFPPFPYLDLGGTRTSRRKGSEPAPDKEAEHKGCGHCHSCRTEACLAFLKEHGYARLVKRSNLGKDQHWAVVVPDSWATDQPATESYLKAALVMADLGSIRRLLKKAGKGPLA